MSSTPLTAKIGEREFIPSKSKCFETWRKFGFLDLEKLFCEAKIELDTSVPVTYEWHKGIIVVGLSAVCG